MILVVGIPSEPPVRRVLDAAEAQGIEVVLLNPREAAHADLLLHQSGGHARLMLHRAGALRDLSQARGVYTRLGTEQGLPEYHRGTTEARARIAAWHGLLNDWMETTPVPVLNRIKACNSNMSKPYQARIIAACGLAVPETLVTNDPEAARAFRARHGTVIFKSISAHRSIVRKLEGSHLARLSQLRCLPVQFQQWVEGTDIRVHVIGEAVFATRIESTAEDYRYARHDGEAAEYTPTRLPSEIEDACRRLSRRLDLPLCGIDLRQTPDGRYICFEVNPSPAYSCYEEQTGQPISHAIVRWLATGGGGVAEAAVECTG
ncbi:ATP-grasp domain-containing protein [Salipiger mangrovisoli]|uniref:ATP-grasp domain-containing protein n=1 Tax=Salipiger mangrovisoli TaxID=2865933 RepID=A0ABR9X033_9RHOB|nr:hypothetical protein [Salipiger mangrovisoli]MBE9636909.1 hypothetical protein [Salipiger mangrovisoli]